MRALALAKYAKPDPADVGVIARPSECDDAVGQQVLGDQLLDAGADLSREIAWKAQLVDGVPAELGAAKINIRFAYRNAQDGDGIYQPLVASSEIAIAGEQPRTVSAAQALDALLADKGFGAWLRDAPSSTWLSANVFLQNLGPGDNGIVPDGPSWEVDVFRVVDGQRQRAIAFVDPTSGKVRSVNLCDRDCGTSE